MVVRRENGTKTFFGCYPQDHILLPDEGVDTDDQYGGEASLESIIETLIEHGAKVDQIR